MTWSWATPPGRSRSLRKAEGTLAWQQTSQNFVLVEVE